MKIPRRIVWVSKANRAVHAGSSTHPETTDATRSSHATVGSIVVHTRSSCTTTAASTTPSAYSNLSRNRFCELPEDITCLAFLERLLVYHNTIRSVPETIRGLHSLTYLDLRNNQLSVLPREICALPLQVLLVSNNRLATLPDEFGRMEKLTELDAACNQITHLPARMGDLRNLRSLNLRSNQLVYLPRDLTCLELAFLDISSNKIATLPVELRHMTSLVDLELSNNPLTSPPASLCVRGLVHVFKYLETVASREEKSKTGIDGHATLRRTALTAKNSSSCLLDNQQRNRRAYVDSGYCTSDGGFDGKRWMHEEDVHRFTTSSSKWSPTQMHPGFTVMPRNGSNHNTTSNPSSGGQQAALSTHMNHGVSNDSTLDSSNAGPAGGNNDVNDISPEGDITPEGTKIDDKGRTLSNYQTYREYKEALRQQLSPHHSMGVQKMNQINANPNGSHSSMVGTTGAHSSPLLSPNRNGSQASSIDDSSGGTPNKRPVQKVIPSRNIGSSHHNQSPTHLNGNHNASGTASANIPNGSHGKMTLANGSGKGSLSTVSWNRDVPTEKLSFTMRREFDKQKEETELIEQLRQIIETRLKMSLPQDIAPALMDGVVLCHLANLVRPRSVGSIHVPSSAVNLLCCAADVLEGRGIVQVAITVVELLKFYNPASNVRSPTRNMYAIGNSNNSSGGSGSSSNNGSNAQKSNPSTSSLSSPVGGNAI
uniref:Calponin-homology (CH) domain-containing protein n=1 Tax=Anopheles epiroticus TaxID=199890 RepID=A0A182PUP6_9DIPT